MTARPLGPMTDGEIVTIVRAPIPWPAADTATISSRGFRHYQTPDGNFPSVTTILKVVGTGTEGLIKWSANEERKACLEAAAEVWATEEHAGPSEFAGAVESRLGAARSHQRQLAKAADIGTSIHQMIQWTLRAQLDEPQGPPPHLSEPAEVAFMSWSDWWRAKGLVPVRVEQPVWDPIIGYAGTIDLLAGGPNGLELWDWKSSKGVYDGHHIQAAAYLKAANRWAPVVAGGIVHLPKDIDGDLRAHEVPIGHMYGNRTLSVDQLFGCFNAALHLWNNLVRPVEG